MREAHWEVAEEKLVVPPERVPQEYRTPPQASGSHGPDGVASAAEGGYAWSVGTYYRDVGILIGRQANDRQTGIL